MVFDPDAYLRERKGGVSTISKPPPPEDSFDPDAYLADFAPEPPVAIQTPETQGDLEVGLPAQGELGVPMTTQDLQDLPPVPITNFVDEAPAPDPAQPVNFLEPMSSRTIAQQTNVPEVAEEFVPEFAPELVEPEIPPLRAGPIERFDAYATFLQSLGKQKNAENLLDQAREGMERNKAFADPSTIDFGLDAPIEPQQANAEYIASAERVRELEALLPMQAEDAQAKALKVPENPFLTDLKAGKIKPGTISAARTGQYVSHQQQAYSATFMWAPEVAQKHLDNIKIAQKFEEANLKKSNVWGRIAKGAASSLPQMGESIVLQVGILGPLYWQQQGSGSILAAMVERSGKKVTDLTVAERERMHKIAQSAAIPYAAAEYFTSSIPGLKRLGGQWAVRAATKLAKRLPGNSKLLNGIGKYGILWGLQSVGEWTEEMVQGPIEGGAAVLADVDKTFGEMTEAVAKGSAEGWWNGFKSLPEVALISGLGVGVGRINGSPFQEEQTQFADAVNRRDFWKDIARSAAQPTDEQVFENELNAAFPDESIGTEEGQEIPEDPTTFEGPDQARPQIIDIPQPPPIPASQTIQEATDDDLNVAKIDRILEQGSTEGVGDPEDLTPLRQSAQPLETIPTETGEVPGGRVIGEVPVEQMTAAEPLSPYPTLKVSVHEGEKGERSHITRIEKGSLPTSTIVNLKGEVGEVRGEHRNRKGAKWEEFKDDIRKNGIKNPIFILQDPGSEAVISEGNHRLDAAVELGLTDVPVEIRYFGKAEEEGLAYTLPSGWTRQGDLYVPPKAEQADVKGAKGEAKPPKELITPRERRKIVNEMEDLLFNAERSAREQVLDARERANAGDKDALNELSDLHGQLEDIINKKNRFRKAEKTRGEIIRDLEKETDPKERRLLESELRDAEDALLESAGLPTRHRATPEEEAESQAKDQKYQESQLPATLKKMDNKESLNAEEAHRAKWIGKRDPELEGWTKEGDLYVPPKGEATVDLTAEAKKYKTADEFVEEYTIKKPELTPDEISDMANYVDNNMQDDAINNLNAKGKKFIDGYYVADVESKESILKDGVKKGASWYGREEAVYFFADPDDIKLATPYLAMKVDGDEGGRVSVIHFRLPVDDIQNMKWDGLFNVQNETYSSFLINKDIAPKQIVETKSFHIPSATDFESKKFVKKAQLTDIWNKAQPKKKTKPSKPVKPKQIPLNQGERVMARKAAHLKEHSASVVQVLDKDTVRVRISGEKVIRDLPRELISLPMAVVERRKVDALLAKLSKDKRKQVKRDAKRFDDALKDSLVIDFREWEVEGISDRSTAILRQQVLQRAREESFRLLGEPDTDFRNPIERARLLPALEVLVEELNAQQAEIDARLDVDTEQGIVDDTRNELEIQTQQDIAEVTHDIGGRQNLDLTPDQIRRRRDTAHIKRGIRKGAYGRAEDLRGIEDLEYSWALEESADFPAMLELAEEHSLQLLPVKNLSVNGLLLHESGVVIIDETPSQGTPIEQLNHEIFHELKEDGNKNALELIARVKENGPGFATYLELENKARTGAGQSALTVENDLEEIKTEIAADFFGELLRYSGISAEDVFQEDLDRADALVTEITRDDMVPFSTRKEADLFTPTTSLAPETRIRAERAQVAPEDLLGGLSAGAQQKRKQDAAQKEAEDRFLGLMGFETSARKESIAEDKAYMEAAERGDLETAQRMVDEKAKGLDLIEAYHGTQRIDRVGTRLDPKRATSGPMPFFTDDKAMAEGYSKGKQDTSIEIPDSYVGWFAAKMGRGKPKNIAQAWYHLTPEKRQEITEKFPRVTNVDREGNEMEGYRLGEEDERGGIMSSDSWDYYAKQARGNILQTGVDVWLHSGSLYGSEEDFLEVLKLAGMDNVTYESPYKIVSGVLNARLSIRNPFDTSNISDEDYQALINATKGKRGSNMWRQDNWDKRSVSGSVWREWLQQDREDGSAHAWTSIPDWITKALIERGYDGIKDVGGKGGGRVHNVWIPFYPWQVKQGNPITRDNKGNIIPLSQRFNPEKEDIRFSTRKPTIVAELTTQIEKGEYNDTDIAEAFTPSEREDDISPSDITRWRNKIESNKQEDIARYGGANQRLKRVDVSDKWAESGVFRKIRNVLSQKGIDTIPVSPKDFGGVTLSDSDIMLSDSEYPEYYAIHETGHVYVNRGDKDILSLVNLVDKKSPVFQDWYRILIGDKDRRNAYFQNAKEELGIEKKKLLSAKEKRAIQDWIENSIAEEIAVSWLGGLDFADAFTNPSRATTLRGTIATSIFSASSRKPTVVAKAQPPAIPRPKLPPPIPEDTKAVKRSKQDTYRAVQLDLRNRIKSVMDKQSAAIKYARHNLPKDLREKILVGNKNLVGMVREATRQKHFDEILKYIDELHVEVEKREAIAKLKKVRKKLIDFGVHKLDPIKQEAAQSLLDSFDVKTPKATLELRKVIEEMRLDPNDNTSEDVLSEAMKSDRRNIKEMDIDDIRYTTIVFQTILSEQNAENKARHIAKARENKRRVRAGIDVMEKTGRQKIPDDDMTPDIMTVKEFGGTLKQRHRAWVVKPSTLTMEMDGGNEGPITEAITNKLWEGTRREYGVHQEVTERLRAFIERKNIDIRDFSKHFSTTAQKQLYLKLGLKWRFTPPKTFDYMMGGKRIPLTKDQRIELFLYSRNPDNLRHLLSERGGFVLPDNRTAGVRKVSAEELQKVIDDVEASPDEMAIANEISDIYDEMLSGFLNESSLAMNGYTIADVLNYYPIVTSATHRYYDAFKEDSVVKDMKQFSRFFIESMGPTKHRTAGADNPVILSGAFSTLNTSMRLTALYYGYAEELRDVKAFMRGNMEDGEGFMKTVEGTMVTRWGRAYWDAINSLVKTIEDSQSRIQPMDKFYNTLLNNTTRAILSMNLPVAGMQVVSYYTGGAVVPSKYINAGSFKNAASYKEMGKYSPVLWARGEGRMSIAMGESMSAGAVRQMWLGEKGKLLSEKGTKPISFMDQQAIGRLWRASEAWVKDWNAGVKKEGLLPLPDSLRELLDSDADFGDKVARLTEFVIRETQPSYELVDRPFLARSKNIFAKVTMRFSSQRGKNGSINIRNKVLYHNSKKTLRDKMRYMKLLILIQVFQATMFALIKMARQKVDGYDDEDNDFPFLLALIREVISVNISNVTGPVAMGVEGVFLGSLKKLTGKGPRHFKLEDPIFQLLNLIATNIIDGFGAMKEAHDKTITPLGERKWLKTVTRISERWVKILSYGAGQGAWNLYRETRGMNRTIRKFISTPESEMEDGFKKLDKAFDADRITGDQLEQMKNALRRRMIKKERESE